MPSLGVGGPESGRCGCRCPAYSRGWLARSARRCGWAANQNVPSGHARTCSAHVTSGSRERTTARKSALRTKTGPDSLWARLNENLYHRLQEEVRGNVLHEVDGCASHTIGGRPAEQCFTACGVCQGRRSSVLSKGDWNLYEAQFLNLMRERKIEDNVSPALLDGGCLLCSEETPHHCHRRLVAEYLRAKWGGVEIEHIV